MFVCLFYSVLIYCLNLFIWFLFPGTCFMCSFVLNTLLDLFVGFVCFMFECLLGLMFSCCLIHFFVWLVASDFVLLDDVCRYGEAVLKHAKHVT